MVIQIYQFQLLEILKIKDILYAPLKKFNYIIENLNWGYKDEN